ncbi:hypothetical protein EUGRSUZ_G00262 [Eucalyptus grandis]|uniref:Uncharacterized protein n=2 Tax=Eucalyptus grandis TaxID=71139 RepID=A0ACC3K3A2_EUCGR|nr:hypothetical protein EUGRSUZ_G00262 [Eucalyptus grandis]
MKVVNPYGSQQDLSPPIECWAFIPSSSQGPSVGFLVRKDFSFSPHNQIGRNRTLCFSISQRKCPSIMPLIGGNRH